MCYLHGAANMQGMTNAMETTLAPEPSVIFLALIALSADVPQDVQCAERAISVYRRQGILECVFK